MDKETLHHVHPAILARARELRRPQTPVEAQLWAHLRNRQWAGLKFRRQYPIDRFIVDFYCAAARLIVEVDGESHAAQVEYDAARTTWLEAAGYRVLRVTNADVRESLEGVLLRIREACLSAGSPLDPEPLP